MATDQWKRNNPKITGHISKDLKDKLDKFIKEEQLKGTSEALRIIIERYFDKTEVLTKKLPEKNISKSTINSIEERLGFIELTLKEHKRLINMFKPIPDSKKTFPGEF